MILNKLSKNKKGYVLMTTVVMMFVVLALSSVVLVLVKSVSNNKTNATINFNLSVVARQVSIDFVSLSEGDFIAKMGESCEIEESENEKYFINKKDSLIYKIAKENGVEVFCIEKINKNQNKTLIEIRKVGDKVVMWKRYI